MEEIVERKTSLKTQSAWIMLAKIISFGLSILFPLLIVRILGKDQVGIYRQVFQVITDAIVILPFGFGMSAYYFLARNKEKHAAAILNILLFNFVIGGVTCLILFLFPQLIGNIFKSNEITLLTPKIGVVIWIWLFSTFLEMVAIANQEAPLATVFIIFAQFSKMVLMVSAVLFFSTVDAFIYAAMIQGAIQTIILCFYLNSRFPKFWQSFDTKFFREQLVYALPFGGVGLLWILQNNIHNYFIGNRFSNAEYAIYAIGCFDLPLLGVLYESVASVMISRVSELQSKNDKREILHLTTKTMQTLSFFYLPAAVFLFITANTFITTLFTHQYSASVPIFLINLIVLPLYILITDPIIRAYKELSRLVLVTRFFILIGLISTLWLGIQYLDLQGMAWIVVTTIVIERFFSTSFAIRQLEAKWQDIGLLKNVGKTALIAVFSGIITYFVYQNVIDLTMAIGLNITNMIFSSPKESAIDFISGGLTMAVSLFTYIPIYLLLMNYFGVIDESEKESFYNIANKVKGFFKKDLGKELPTEIVK